MALNVIWQAEDVVRAIRGQCLHEQNWIAQGISIDSRTANAGDLFIALEGPTHDAHEFVHAAFAKGAVAAIVKRQAPQVPPQAPLLYVDDTFTALQDLGQAGRQRAQASIVAVTGSVGKTSTKEMLRLMLSAIGDTYANEGSLNNQWGVPLSLARLPAEARYGVFEIGMNHAGELGPLSQQVRPKVALITTIEAVHLEFFDSIEAIADAKAEIFLGMDAEGAAILNRDNPQFARLAAAARAQGIKRALSFGRDAKSDARLIEHINGVDGSTIQAEIHGRVLTYRLGAPGLHLAFNSLGALLAAVAAGGDVEACAAALFCYRQPEGRGVIETIRTAQGSFTLIDESYNASPVAVRAAIRVLSQMTPGPDGKRIVVLGDMRELGAAAPKLHAELAKDLIEGKIDRVYCCGEMMTNLYNALPPGLRGGSVQDSALLAPQVTADIRPGDIVTIKGSHSMRMELVVTALKALDQTAKHRKLAS